MFTLNSDNSIGICQSLILNKRNSRWVYGNFFGVYGKNSNSHPFRINQGVFEGHFYASGTALLLRKSVIEVLGYLFDEKQFTADLDLSWRVRLQGYRVVTNVKSICIHFQGHSSRLVLKNKLNTSYVVFKDALRTFLRNYSTKSLFKRFPLFLSFLLLLSLLQTIVFKAPAVFSLIRAVVLNLCSFKSTWYSHLMIQSTRKISDKNLEMSMLPYPSELFFFRLKVISIYNRPRNESF